MATVSLVTTAVLAVAVLVFFIRHGLYVLVGLGGLLLAIAGGWWIVTEGMPRRAVGVAGLAAGGGIVIWALVRAANDGERVVLKFVVVAALYALAIFAARDSLAGVIEETDAESSHQAHRPAHPVLLCNPRSGGGKVQKFGLVELATSLGIDTVVLEPGRDLEQLAREAVESGADCLGMAGGDGSQALVASIAVEYDVPFVCVAAGTRNHFALDLGLNRDDPRQSVYAFRDAIERRVDYATVNDRFFVNNVSLGVYATIVQQEGYREAKSETSQRLLPELLGRTAEPFDLQFMTPDGTKVDGAFLIMVCHNPYILRASLDASQRRRLDSGRLGVFAVSTTTGAQAAQVLTLELAGHGAKSHHAFEFTTEKFEIGARRGQAFAGIDGEALELPTPLEFRIHPGGLRMLVPKGNLGSASRRRAREVSLRDLPAIARGSPIGSGND